MIKIFILNKFHIFFIVSLLVSTGFSCSTNEGVSETEKETKKEVDKEETVKVLAVGNSFSDDALEHYLSGLAQAAGKKLIIGNMYIGGSNLNQHVENARDDKAAYSYRKIDENGALKKDADVALKTAIIDEDWDYISFQQVSSYSGEYESFIKPLPELYDYVHEKATNDEVKYILHQTWAYAQNSTHSGFDNYQRDQTTMYEAIVETYDQVKGDLINADMVVPAGTAIQNARSSLIGDSFNRDGYHLNELGRYIASAVWLEKLFDLSVIDNDFAPDMFSDFEIEVAKHAAHEAVKQPDLITELTEFQKEGSLEFSDPILINFGKEGNLSNWNNLNSPNTDISINNLKDVKENYTGVSIKILEKFSSINTNGPASTSVADFDMSANISGDSFYGHLTDWNGRNPVKEGVIEVGGLKRDENYKFCFYSGRANVNDNRETQFTVKGEKEEVVYLNAANNASKTVCSEKMSPNDEGSVSVSVTAGPGNNEEHKFYYVNAMRISAD